MSLAEAKLHLRVDFTDDDALITSLIAAARMAAENICRRAFVTQKWELTLDGFPRQNFFGSLSAIAPVDAFIPNIIAAERGYVVRFRGGKIELPKPVLRSVDYIKYLDEDGVEQTLDSSQYVVDAVGEPGAVTPLINTYWPTTQNVMNSVRIGFTAGYGAAADVPDGIKSWIKLRVATLYSNREEVAVLNRGKVEMLPYVDSLLDPYLVVYL
ncbi:head-tail connector protein [Ralstonia sp. L16]|uniref:head-tail connector protein n=1 Tax=Ralstonia sp. L16 TaxID=3423950 RepID=UPI003F7A179E